MRAPGLNAERDRPTGLASQPAGVLRTGESAFHLPPGQAWLRRLLLLMPLALALGGCTMVQADPVDRAAIGSYAPREASAPRVSPAGASDDAAWRLRLTRL